MSNIEEMFREFSYAQKRKHDPVKPQWAGEILLEKLENISQNIFIVF